MKAFHCDQFAYPLPPGHRFPADKYGLLRRQVERELVPPCQLEVPQAASEEELRLVHTAEYVGSVLTGGLSERETRRIGLPWSPELVERCRRSVGSTIGAGRTALRDGLAVSLTGGTHHAFAGHGEGFCLFNDCAVAARVLQAEGRLRGVAVVDCDVHQGNGTASIFADDPSVYTFSIHGAKNFPFRKERSDLDVELPDGAGDEMYLQLLRVGLRQTLSKAKADMVFYIAGADPFSGDALGRLAVTKEGLAERDRLVLGACRDAGLPVAVVMGGGYARDIHDTVAIQFETVRSCLLLAGQSATPRIG